MNQCLSMSARSVWFGETAHRRCTQKSTVHGGLQIADEGFDGVHQENVILENIPKEKILGKLSEEEAKGGAATSTFTAPPIDSILSLYDLEQVRLRLNATAEIERCST